MTTLPHVIQTEHDGVAVVSPIGEFDVSSVEMLRSIFIDAVDPARNRLVIDLSGTLFVDSMALGVMLGANRRVVSWGGWIRLVAPQPNVRRVLAVTGFDKVFALYDSVAEAVAHQMTADPEVPPAPDDPDPGIPEPEIDEPITEPVTTPH